MRLLVHDIRFALRLFRKNPGSNAIAVLTLALGIAANTAIFSVVNGTLLLPLRWEKPEQLIRIYEIQPQDPDKKSDLTAPDFVELQNLSRSFESIAAIAERNTNVSSGGEPEIVKVAVVSPGFFPLLRARTAVGRLFLPEEYALPSNASFEPMGGWKLAGVPGSATVILSYRLWQRWFGADPGAIGKTIRMDQRQATIVGVLPAGFSFVDPKSAETADCWLPHDFQRESSAPGYRYLKVIGRLSSGVAHGQAQAEMDAVAQRLGVERPKTNQGWSLKLVSLKDSIVGDSRSLILLLSGAVGSVLLIGCANIANLLLARASGRHREMAVRRSLGAGRSRLLIQLLTESALLSSAGGLLGLILANWGLKSILLSAPRTLPRIDEIAIDSNVLSFTAAVTLLTGILCGLAPAYFASKADITAALKNGVAGLFGKRPGYFRDFMVVSEIALALVLLIGGGLMANSFVRLASVELGFNPRKILTVGFSPLNYRVDYPQLLESFFSRAATLPGVEGVASGYAPLMGGSAGLSFKIEGRDDQKSCTINPISPNYFRVLGIRLLQGRGFDDIDTARSPYVAIFNSSAAREYWPGGNPVGKRIAVGDPQKQGWITIVGVVEDVRTIGLEKTPGPELYLPSRQSRMVSVSTVLMRTKGDPRLVLPLVKKIASEMDPDMAVTRIATLEEVFDRSLAPQRFNLALVGGFSTLAFVLAGFGIFSVVAYAVSARKQEIGIRVALGAARSDVLQLIMGKTALLIVLGVGSGLLAAIALNRVAAAMVYGITTTDPTTYLGASVLWIVVSVLASYIPTRGALKVDPILALRQE